MERGLGAGAASAVSNVREWWSKPAELSTEALENYEILTRLYRQAFPEVELPEFWLLDEEYRPKFKVNYMQEDRCFDNAIKRLDDDYRQIALLQKGMHVTVKQFLHLLSKRNPIVSHIDSGAVRCDGVELMFVMEMVVWMRELFKPESPQSMLELKQRLKYMDRICNELTTNNRFLYYFDLDESRANFKSFCNRLMEHFQGCHDYLEQKAFNISLVDHVKQVNENLSVLISTYCNILYAFIASPSMENSPSRYFLDLHLFLNPVSSDQKILGLRRKELSNWLENTLSVAGIRNNGYVPEQALTKDNIQKHLEGKVPGDQHDAAALGLLDHAWV